MKRLVCIVFAVTIFVAAADVFAQDYQLAPIVEIIIKEGKEAIPEFQMIDFDLDKGMSSWDFKSKYIYLFYRRSWNESPITGLYIAVGGPVRSGYKNAGHLNTVGRGDFICLYYTKESNSRPITDLSVRYENQPLPGPWKRIDVNLNKGGGKHGDNIYLWYKQSPTKQSPTTQLAGITIGNRTSGTGVEAQNMKNYGNNWSNNDQLFWGSKAVGDKLDIMVVLPPSPNRSYQLYAKLTKAPDFGRFSFRHGSKEIGQQDLYGDRVYSTQLVLIGQFTAAQSGPIPITVQVVGKNSRSHGYKFGIDTIQVKTE